MSGEVGPLRSVVERLMEAQREALEVTNQALDASVTAGESLYLVVEDNGDSNCDSTGVRLVIETQ